MDRPKHRRFLLLGFALLACALALLGWQWRSASVESAHPVAGQPQTRQLVDPEPVETEQPASAPKPGATAAPPVNTAESGNFRGRVIDAVTRQPVPEFEIHLIPGVTREGIVTTEPRASQTFQAANGRFTWQNAPAGKWKLKVAAPRYQHFRLEELSIVAGKATREITVPLQRGHTLRGRVFDQVSGAGIPDAWISFKDPSAWRGDMADDENYAKSKDDGTFVLDGVPGGNMIVSAGAGKHAYREMPVEVSNDTPPLEIGLATGGKIAGMVVAPDGTPVKGFVYLNGPGIGFIHQLDETGSFSFEHRPAGRYAVRANTAAGSANLDIELAENEIREGLVLQVAEGRSVRGVVRGVRPEQLAKTHISLHTESRSAYLSTKPDELGAYALNGVPPGRATVTAYADMSREVSKKVTVPADKDVALDIVFAPGARLSGRVTQGAKPASNKHIWLRSADNKGDALYRARSEEDGRYEIEGVPPGDYRIRADDDVSRVLSIAGDTVFNIDIPLVQIGGRVVEDGGDAPIVGAEVYVRGVDAATDRVHAYRKTNHFGQFAVTGMEPGEVVLTVYKPGYEMHRERIAYGTPITSKNITLRKGGGVEIRVHRPTDAKPVHGIVVTEKMRGDAWDADLWIPIDSEGIGHLPSALAGSTLEFQGFGDKPIVIQEWDGQSLELKL
jgi:hypothetical protein